MSKRILDLVVALAMLLPLLPILVIVAVILRFTGERHVFYIQSRRGKGGEVFGLIKFATMVVDSENIGSKDITVKNDPRVLPFGRILRKTKINELTQLLNVLKGDMSIVGWRPLMQAGLDCYSEEVRQKLFKIKPGLTGIGSIMFRDEEHILHLSDKPHEECYRLDIMPYKSELEVWYTQKQSIGLDIKIILATAIAVLMPSSSFYLKMFPDLPSLDESSEITRIRRLQPNESTT